MNRYELRLALIRTVFGAIAAVAAVIGVVFAGIHLWLFVLHTL